MTCDTVREKLTEYLDGALPREEMKSIREHLLLCPSCNREYLALSEIKELLGQTFKAPLPEGFDDRLHEALLQEKQTDRPVLPLKRNAAFYRKYAAAAAVFLVLLISVPAAFLHESQNKEGLREDLPAKAEMLLANGKQESAAEEEGLVSNENLSQPSDQSREQTEKKAGVFHDSSESGTDGDLHQGRDGAALQRSGSSGQEAPAPENRENPSSQNPSFGAGGSGGTDQALMDGAASSPALAEKGVTAENGVSEASAASEGNDEAAAGQRTQSGTVSAGGVSDMETAESTGAAKAETGDAGTGAEGSSGSSPVIRAAYQAGAKTYNDALDFVSFIADNDKEGLIRWIIAHSESEISQQDAEKLAGEYIQAYGAS